LQLLLQRALETGGSTSIRAFEHSEVLHASATPMIRPRRHYAAAASHTTTPYSVVLPSKCSVVRFRLFAGMVNDGIPMIRP
jgi:hypothetical protein